MGAVLSRGVAADGVLAWQDNQDPKTFHYFPSRIDAELGSTIQEFEVTYYGIGAKPYYQKISPDPTPQSVVGGVLSGLAVPDISEAQRKNITEAITKQYEVEPNLVPIMLSDVKIQPVFAKKLAEMGQGSSQEFPSTLQIGSQIAYTVSSGNSLFAEMTAREGADEESASPQFAINLVGTAAFYGDPWKARISCDLSKVWSYTRTKVNVGASIGWFNIGVDVDKITQELISSHLIEIDYIEGSGGEEFGRQMLETTKTLFEAISQKALGGEGLFRFEPNPAPQEPPKDDKWGASLLPWTCSINTAYQSNFFNQEIKFDETISFTGKVDVLLASAMSLAVQCGADTVEHFHDLQASRDECVTPEKSQALQDRLSAEVAAKNKKVQEYAARVESGQWTVATFKEMLAWLNTISLTESAIVTMVDGQEVVRQLTADEALAALSGEESRRIYLLQRSAVPV